MGSKLLLCPQELEGELGSLQAVLNASLKLTEQFDILQKRVVLLEEIFLRLSGQNRISSAKLDVH